MNNGKKKKERMNIVYKFENESTFLRVTVKRGKADLELDFTASGVYGGNNRELAITNTR